MINLSNENVVHIIRNGVQYLQFKKLIEYKNTITHAYSIGIDVNYRTAKINKKTEYRNIVKTNQEHTDNVAIVSKKINQDFPDINLEEYQNTDGIITNKQNLILSTTNADCILLLFFDPITKTIANVHSGWKGTLQRISVKTVKKMKKEFGCKPENIICCICPSIRKCHFEVDEDVKEKFEKEFKDINITKEIAIMEKQKNEEKWNIDTVLINKILLKKEGLKEENIVDSGICSMCNSEIIHSYRAEKENYGLETALIELK